MSQLTYFETQKINFDQCALHLLSLTSANDEASLAELNKLLDQLNSYDYNIKLLDNEIGEKLLCRCAVLVPLNNEHLIAKFCPVVNHFVRKQNIQLSKETLLLLLEFLVKVIRRCSPWVHSYALLALGTLVYENSSKAEEFWDQLVGCQGILVQPIEDREVLWRALQCIENLTLRNSSDLYLPPEIVNNCIGHFLSYLKAVKSTESDDILRCKILVSCLCGLQNLFLGARVAELPNLGEILASLKFFMFFNIPGNPQIPTFHCLYPSPLSQHYFPFASNSDGTNADASLSPGSKGASSGCKSRKRRSNAKKRKELVDVGSGDTSQHSNALAQRWPTGGFSERQDASTFRPFSWAKISSSESEHSDSEGGNIMRLRSAQSRVRQSALGTLSAVIKTVDRKIMFGYWSSFLPDAPTSTGTLASCLLKDPAPKVRNAALAVVINMLEGAKQFLSLADDREKSKTAFTTLSSTLASTVHELHRSLVLAVIAETSTLVLTQVVKCITTLVQTAPIHKLTSGLLTKTAKHLQPLLDHRDVNVRVAALTAFGAIVGIQPPLQEVSDILQPDPNKINTPESISWLMKLCLQNGTGICTDDTAKSIPLPIRLESIQVLALITKGYFSIVRPALKIMENAIGIGLNDPEVSVKLHSAKLLEELGRSTSKALDCDTANEDAVLQNEVVALWINMISSALPGILQGAEEPTLQVEGCDCLATISAKIFSSLQVNQQVLCETLLLGLSADPGKNVKASATRALGVFVLFPSLREDVSFVIDVSECVVSALADQSLEVRLKSAWTLGNVSDALVLNRDSAALAEFGDEFPIPLLKKLLDASLKASHDNDRVRSNGVRALGNLLRYLQSKHIENTEFKDVIQDSVNSLVKCASTGGNMKVRWNACYALGNVLHNEDLIASFVDYRVHIIETLARLTKDCKNFKVRIKAAAALGIPARRPTYGSSEELVSVWNQLVASLQSIQSSMDFVEYQYHDSLVDQICSTLCHLASLLDEEDILPLSVEMAQYVETLNAYFKKCISHLNASKDSAGLMLSKLPLAQLNLLELKLGSKDKSETKTRCLENLLGVFQNDC